MCLARRLSKLLIDMQPAQFPYANIIVANLVTLSGGDIDKMASLLHMVCYMKTNMTPDDYQALATIFSLRLKVNGTEYTSRLPKHDIECPCGARSDVLAFKEAAKNALQGYFGEADDYVSTMMYWFDEVTKFNPGNFTKQRADLQKTYNCVVLDWKRIMLKEFNDEYSRAIDSSKKPAKINTRFLNRWRTDLNEHLDWQLEYLKSTLLVNCGITEDTLKTEMSKDTYESRANELRTKAHTEFAAFVNSNPNIPDKSLVISNAKMAFNRVGGPNIEVLERNLRDTLDDKKEKFSQKYPHDSKPTDHTVADASQDITVDYPAKAEALKERILGDYIKFADANRIADREFFVGKLRLTIGKMIRENVDLTELERISFDILNGIKKANLEALKRKVSDPPIFTDSDADPDTDPDTDSDTESMDESTPPEPDASVQPPETPKSMYIKALCEIIKHFGYNLDEKLKIVQTKNPHLYAFLSALNANIQHGTPVPNKLVPNWASNYTPVEFLQQFPHIMPTTLTFKQAKQPTAVGQPAAVGQTAHKCTMYYNIVEECLTPKSTTTPSAFVGINVIDAIRTLAKQGSACADCNADLWTLFSDVFCYNNVNLTEYPTELVFGKNKFTLWKIMCKRDNSWTLSPAISGSECTGIYKRQPRSDSYTRKPRGGKIHTPRPQPSST